MLLVKSSIAFQELKHVIAAELNMSADSVDLMTKVRSLFVPSSSHDIICANQQPDTSPNVCNRTTMNISAWLPSKGGDRFWLHVQVRKRVAKFSAAGPAQMSQRLEQKMRRKTQRRLGKCTSRKEGQARQNISSRPLTTVSAATGLRVEARPRRNNNYLRGRTGALPALPPPLLAQSKG